MERFEISKSIFKIHLLQWLKLKLSHSCATLLCSIFQGNNIIYYAYYHNVEGVTNHTQISCNTVSLMYHRFTMRNGVLSFLILLFMLPAFTPWLPHGAVHALHDHQAKHHGAEDHGHGHAGHEHDAKQKQAAHHPIQFDAVTYFSDYLHVELQNLEQSVLKAPALDTHDVDYTLADVADMASRYELVSIKNRAPPDMRRAKPDKTPLYLSTQRLRI